MMIRISTTDATELHKCRTDLERVLASLDRIGAGIAAIHVNAAIEQLNSNIEVVESARLGADPAEGSRSYKTPELRH